MYILGGYEYSMIDNITTKWENISYPWHNISSPWLNETDPLYNDTILWTNLTDPCTMNATHSNCTLDNMFAQDEPTMPASDSVELVSLGDGNWTALYGEIHTFGYDMCRPQPGPD
jgi:hypothetical protein